MLLCRHRNSEGSVEMSEESESETDSSLADEDSNGQLRRRSSTASKKRRWLKEEVITWLISYDTISCLASHLGLIL